MDASNFARRTEQTPDTALSEFSPRSGSLNPLPASGPNGAARREDEKVREPPCVVRLGAYTMRCECP
jgi:hypothetical protein